MKIKEYKHLILPVFICQDALIKGYVNQLRLFVYLKLICSGHFRMKKKFVEQVCKDLNISRNSFYKYRIWLIKNKFITLNSKSGSHRIVGFSQLYWKSVYRNRYGTYMEWKDLRTFKAFAIAAVMTFVSEKIIKAQGGEEPSELNLLKRSSRKNGSASLKPFIMPVNYYAMVIAKTPKTARNHKSICTEAGYLIFENRYEQVSDNPRHFARIKKYHPESNRLVIANDCLQLQEPDIMISKISLSRIRSFRWNKTVPKYSPEIIKRSLEHQF